MAQRCWASVGYLTRRPWVVVCFLPSLFLFASPIPSYDNLLTNMICQLGILWLVLARTCTLYGVYGSAIASTAARTNISSTGPTYIIGRILFGSLRNPPNKSIWMDRLRKGSKGMFLLFYTYNYTEWSHCVGLFHNRGTYEEKLIPSLVFLAFGDVYCK